MIYARRECAFEMKKYHIGKEFLSNMSHEVRTPLNVIVGMCDIAMRHTDDRDKVENCLRKISVAGDHLIDLVDNLLDITKIEQGCIDIQEREFEVDKLVDEIKIMTESSASRKNLIFDIASKEVINRKVRGDYGHVLRAMLNIVSNAVKYTPDGGFVKVVINEVYNSDQEFTTYKFTCRDNGIGMSEEFLEKVYNPFVRADDIRVNQINGSGLGMSIVKKIVEALDGDIEIHSKEGTGTSVILTFSFRVSGVKKDIEEIREQEHERITDRRIVLIAEDQQENREVLVDYLNDLGIQSEYAMNGEQAVDMFIESEEGTYKAVFMDIEMPVLDGYKASLMIRGLNRRDKNIPIIALTANAFQSDREKALKAGMDHYLTKPLKMEALSELLHKEDAIHLL